MKKTETFSGRFSRRRFIQVVGVAGGAAVCWQLGLFGPNRPMQVARRSMPIMGTVMNLTLYGPDRDQCEEAINRCFRVMADLEKTLSRHLPESELSRLNRTGVLDNPSRPLREVLKQAAALNRQSDGSFDVTILPVLRLYEQADTLPDRKLLALADSHVNFEHVRIRQDRISFDKPNMAISLDGIAKGYIVDQGTRSLCEAGFADVYVEAGGDLMVKGLREGKTPWRIGIRPPRSYQTSRPKVVRVSDRAVATSGDYLQAFTPDLSSHHILDPHSGTSPGVLASCTVIAPNCMLADGLATTLMVLGPEPGRELIESMPGVEAYMIGKDLTEYSTSSFFT